MKENFSDSNYIQHEITKDLFKKHWISSSSANQNPKEKIIQRRLMTSGSGGYGGPAIIKYINTEGKQKKDG